MQETPGWNPGLGRSLGGGNGNLLQYSCLGQKSMVCYSPWSRRELGMTEHTVKVNLVDKWGINVSLLCLAQNLLKEHGILP